ncbi:unnamed protein product [Phytophthora lilii]|uniref:Unnamed protein product n=1 Tax=Phytophthora lilii TaxID=2077276 RepID=A0A9W6TCG3_9STRA|nr:unnamed protein product [Phytophthora lilii]
MVVEYLRVFRYGLNTPDTATSLCLDEDFRQKRFLQATMTSDASSNGGFGIDAILRGWRFRSLHHDDMEVRLVRLEQSDEVTTTALVNGYTTVTKRMLLNSLPQLTDAKNEAKWSSAWKLIGQTLVVLTTVKLQWDDAQTNLSVCTTRLTC